MLNWFRNFLGLKKRGLDAAGGGRRWVSAPTANASTVHAGAGTISQRASHFALNTAIGSRITETLVGNTTGCGIKPRSLHPSEAVRARLHRDFLAWTDEADFDGRSDFYGLQASLVRDMIVHGEALAQLVEDADGLRLRRLHPEQLARSETRLSVGQPAVYQGIELDKLGKVTGYHILDEAPGSALQHLSIKPRRYPAGEIVHLYRPLVPGQLRGLSWFAPILMTARELDALMDAIATRAKVAALFAGIIQDPDGSGLLDGNQIGSTVDAALEPGALVSLPPGKTVEFPAMPDQGSAKDLLTSQCRAIAAGVGLPYETLTGDYSQATYSSARQAMLEFRRLIEAVQHHTVVFQLCRPVWRRWVRSQVIGGRLSATAYSADRSAFEVAKWVTPAWSWIDPEKEAKAAEISIGASIRSRSEVIAERGYDAEEVDSEIAADKARAERLGIQVKPQPKEPVNDQVD